MVQFPQDRLSTYFITLFFIAQTLASILRLVTYPSHNRQFD